MISQNARVGHLRVTRILPLLALTNRIFASFRQRTKLEWQQPPGVGYTAEQLEVALRKMFNIHLVWLPCMNAFYILPIVKNPARTEFTAEPNNRPITFNWVFFFL